MELLPGNLLVVTSMGLALYGCALPLSTGMPESAPPSGVAEGEATRAARLTNEHRARVGCPVLEWDLTAERAAQAHSEDMARRGYFSHTSPEGQSVVERLRAQGITIRRVAENIARGPTTGEQVVRGWLSSPGHRENIEMCAYTHHGIGHRSGYWTHVFYTP